MEVSYIHTHTHTHTLYTYTFEIHSNTIIALLPTGQLMLIHVYTCRMYVSFLYIPWKAIDITEEVNGESLRSVAAPQSFESFKWNAGRPSHKLREDRYQTHNTQQRIHVASGITHSIRCARTCINRHFMR